MKQKISSDVRRMSKRAVFLFCSYIIYMKCSFLSHFAALNIYFCTRRQTSRCYSCRFTLHGARQAAVAAVESPSLCMQRKSKCKPGLQYLIAKALCDNTQSCSVNPNLHLIIKSCSTFRWTYSTTYHICFFTQLLHSIPAC